MGGVVSRWSTSLGFSPSKLLMPLSFSSMLGGMCTLIGTSTNLIVAARYEEDFPEEEPIGLFGPVVYGGPVVLLGVLYMFLAGKSDFLLPPRAACQPDDEIKHDLESGKASAMPLSHARLTT